MKVVVVLLTVALAAASVFAIWPVVADAPWESGSSEVSGGNDRNSPASTRLEVEDAVRESLATRCQGLIQRVESEFLGDRTWEVSVELLVEKAGLRELGSPRETENLVAVYRVRDHTLVARPLNNTAKRIAKSC